MVQTPTRPVAAPAPKPRPKTQYPIRNPNSGKPTVEELERCQNFEIAHVTLIKEEGYDCIHNFVKCDRKKIKISIHSKWNRNQIRDEIDKDPANWDYEIAEVYRPSQVKE